MPNTLSEKNCLSTIFRMLQNCQSIIDFDNEVYTKAFGHDTVAIIQKQAEVMPETSDKGFAIQAMLNIAYDQGFQDCISMIVRILESCGEVSDDALS